MDKYEKIYSFVAIIVCCLLFGFIMDLMLTLIALNMPYIHVAELNALYYFLSPKIWLIIFFITAAMFGVLNYIAYRKQIHWLQWIILLIILMTTVTRFVVVCNNMIVLYNILI